MIIVQKKTYIELSAFKIGKDKPYENHVKLIKNEPFVESKNGLFYANSELYGYK